MRRPYIVCHMMASIDGRIDCDMTEKIETGDEYYEALDLLNLPTTACGRVTATLHYAQPGWFSMAATRIQGEKFHKAEQAEAYSVVFDTSGVLLWEGNRMDEKPMVCIVSQRASQEYLDYLAENQMSYIATGAEAIDLPRAMEILAEEFGVERMGLVGGGKINGAFLSAGLLDEMSLMIAPGVDGRSNQPSVFDGMAEDAQPVKMKLTDFKAYDCGTVWMRYKVGL